MICAKSELCIFDQAAPQVVIENASFEDVFPMNSIKDGSADIEFYINGSTTEYLDLNDTLLYISIKIVDGEKKALLDAADVVPSNYMIHALFKDVILTLNTTKIEGGNGTYAQKAIIETVLNYDTDNKNTILTTLGYHSSDADRKKSIEKSKILSLCSSLQLDFMDQPKYLIPGLNVHLRLKRNDNRFCLETADNKLKPQYVILDTKLMVRRVRVEASVAVGHELGLKKRNAIYPIKTKEIVAFALSKDSSSFYKEQIFGDRQLPNFILVTFQSLAAFDGDYGEKGWIFNHFDVSNISLSRNTDYRETFIQNFETGDYAASYTQSIIRNMGYLDKNMNCGITFTDFKDKYPFFTFVLSPDFDIYQSQLPRQGNLRLDIKFHKPLPKGAYVIIYGLFESELQITSNRTVLK